MKGCSSQGKCERLAHYLKIKPIIVALEKAFAFGRLEIITTVFAHSLLGKNYGSIQRKEKVMI